MLCQYSNLSAKLENEREQSLVLLPQETIETHLNCNGREVLLFVNDYNKITINNLTNIVLEIGVT